MKNEEELILALKKASEVYGKTITKKQYTEWQKSNPEYPGVGKISYTFGTFTQAKRAAGLRPNRVIGKEFTIDELISALKQCADEIGDTFSEVDYEKWRKSRKEIPNIHTIRRRLGGDLNKIKRSIGIEAYEVGGIAQYDEEQIKAYIFEFFQHVLTKESYREWSKGTKAPSLTTIDRHGGFKKLLIETLPDYIERLKKTPRN